MFRFSRRRVLGAGIVTLVIGLITGWLVLPAYADSGARTSSKKVGTGELTATVRIVVASNNRLTAKISATARGVDITGVTVRLEAVQSGADRVLARETGAASASVAETVCEAGDWTADGAVAYAYIRDGRRVTGTWQVLGSPPHKIDNSNRCGKTVSPRDDGDSGIAGKAVARALDIADANRKNPGSRPWVNGATGPTSFDCSGFVYYVYNKAGYTGSRKTTHGYWSLKSKRKPYNDKKAGDLLLVNTPSGTNRHMGIYVGGGKMVDVSSSKGVRVVAISEYNSWPGYQIRSDYVIRLVGA